MSDLSLHNRITVKGNMAEPKALYSMFYCLRNGKIKPSDFRDFIEWRLKHKQTVN